MPQFGSEETPFNMSTGTIASKESRFRKKFNKEAYDFNYDRIFNKASKDSKEIKEYNSLEVNGINEICCKQCYDDLFMKAFHQRDLNIQNKTK